MAIEITMAPRMIAHATTSISRKKGHASEERIDVPLRLPRNRHGHCAGP